MLICDALLDLAKLSLNPVVVLVSVRMQLSKHGEAFLVMSVVNEPMR